MKRVGLLPTLVTAANGYCGVLAVYKSVDGKFYEAAALILLAMLFDMLDGKVARMAGITSRFGAQLDSLSDAISFGVAPAVLVKTTVETGSPVPYHPKLLAILTITFALFAVIRLARYNVEHASGEGSDRQGKGVQWFDGIPTPGAAGVIASLVFLTYDSRALLDYRWVLAILPWLCLGLAILMISRVPYVHFGSRFLSGRRDFGYLFVCVLALGAAVKFPEESAAVGFLLYGLSGPVLALVRRRKPEEVDVPEGV